MKTGIGLRWQHLRQVVSELPDLAWIELINENVFAAGRETHDQLLALADTYPVSMHGVGLNLGGTAPLSKKYLDKLKVEIKELNPFVISDHLCWNGIESGAYLPELLPLPWTDEVISHVSDRINRVQDTIGREILIENVSAYHRWEDSRMPEWDFLNEVVRRSNCGILLDINNIYVNSCNFGYSPERFLQEVSGPVREMHLSGHLVKEGLLIDTHATPVADCVWQLFEKSLKRFGRSQHIPVLIEWDQDLPELDVLISEALKADRIMQRFGGIP